MSADYLKLSEAPTLTYQEPFCSTCIDDCVFEDGWVCPTCGTYWPEDGYDQPGTLYEEWAEESLPGPALTKDEAYRAAVALRRARADAARKATR